jgi:hypothetical protein
MVNERRPSCKHSQFITNSPFTIRSGAETQDRTGDTSIFSAVLYRLSYLGKKAGAGADL